MCLPVGGVVNLDPPVTKRVDALRKEAGFTIIEVLVAGFVLVLGILGVATLVNGANATTGVSQGREGATNLARQVIEAARSVPYTDLDESSAQSEITNSDPSLADVDPATGWQVRTRRRTYTITVLAACSFDDQSDGTAASDTQRPSPPFCTGPANPLDAAGQTFRGSTDQQPDDYKVFRIRISWNVGTVGFSVSQTSLINNPGSSFAPAISSMTPSVLPPVTSVPAGGNITINAVTSRTARSVVWAVNGVTVSPTQTAGSGINWSFTWNVNGLPDQPYLITAQAFKSDGVAGQPRTLTMVLNLRAPPAPTPLFGGRNVMFPPAVAPQVIDLDWQPSADTDLKGFSAWLQNGALDTVPGTANNGSDTADTRVCPSSGTFVAPNVTACQVPNSLVPPQGATARTFYVLGWDTAPNGSTRPGSKATLSVGCYTPGTGCTTFDSPPTTPGTPTATTSGSDVTVTWVASTDPDTGDSIRYYRIYRTVQSGGVCPTAPGVDDRVATVVGSTSFEDSNVGATSCYWVTAADSSLAESAPAFAGAAP
jgi:Tfp pilus assembly protein PilV